MHHEVPVQRQPEQLLAADVAVAVGEGVVDRLARRLQHERGDHLAHAERGDEAVDLQLDDEEPGDEPGDRAGAEGDEHRRRCPASCSLLGEVAGDDQRHRHVGADRQVVGAGGERHEERQRQRAGEHGRIGEHQLDRRPAEERAALGDREHDHEQRPQVEGAVLVEPQALDHEALRELSSWVCSMRSVAIWSPTSVALTRPSVEDDDAVAEAHELVGVGRGDQRGDALGRGRCRRAGGSAPWRRCRCPGSARRAAAASATGAAPWRTSPSAGCRRSTSRSATRSTPS